MSTVDSPRASMASLQRAQTPSSERSSVSVDRATSTSAPSQRRNRTALRDYYGIKAGAVATNSTDITTEVQPSEPPSELDRTDFDPQQYIDQLLAKENLESVLKVETGLISDIRGFDGERKALVYDNYSKLIAATDTIKRMRTNMDPLAPMTSTLEPAVAHIATTAGDLSRSLSERIGGSGPKAGETGGLTEADKDMDNTNKMTVRWVLDTPRRLESMVRDGERSKAEADWTEVDRILEKWNGVKGVEQIREQAKAALAG